MSALSNNSMNFSYADFDGPLMNVNFAYNCDVFDYCESFQWFRYFVFSPFFKNSSLDTTLNESQFI